LTPEQEIKHLDSGATLGENPSKLGTVRLEVDCHGNAELILQRSKEVLRTVIERAKDRWPSNEEWCSILPEWFVVTCSKELPKDEADKWLAWWRKLNPEQKAAAEAAKKWSLPAWIYWLHPDQRLWFWWDAEILTPDHIRVAVEVSHWPFPWGALRWLFIAAGASDVRAEEE
jgi:hypothetical protein